MVNVNDLPTGDVTITGTTAQGEMLTASNTLDDADGVGAITYTWYADDSEVGSGATYKITRDDIGKTITVTANYVDGFGTTESVTSEPTSTVQNVNDSPTGSVTISGTPAQGETLTSSNTLDDADGMGDVSYQWLRDGAVIVGASAATYTLSQTDVGAEIAARATYVDGQGNTETVTSDPSSAVANTNDDPTGSALISGTAEQGQTLTASNDLDDLDGMGPVTYQWLRDGEPIAAATGESYQLAQDDVAANVSVLASYTDGFGTDESVTSDPTAPVYDVNDSPSGVVNISGDPCRTNS